MVEDVYQLTARVHWDKAGPHRAAITVNGKTVSVSTTDEDEAILSTLVTIDPNKDIVTVIAYGASQIKGPFASTVGKPAELTGGQEKGD